jgi:hypothetical protein
LGNVLVEAFAMFIGDHPHVFREKVKMGMHKKKVQ